MNKWLKCCTGRMDGSTGSVSMRIHITEASCRHAWEVDEGLHNSCVHHPHGHLHAQTGSGPAFHTTGSKVRACMRQMNGCIVHVYTTHMATHRPRLVQVPPFTPFCPEIGTHLSTLILGPGSFALWRSLDKRGDKCREKASSFQVLLQQPGA